VVVDEVLIIPVLGTLDPRKARLFAEEPYRARDVFQGWLLPRRAGNGEESW
jgi:hypothetical protein